MFSFILVQMFPGVIIIVPYFILMKTLGLLNTSIGLILAYSVTALPLCVWMLKGYFDTIPRELEETAPTSPKQSFLPYLHFGKLYLTRNEKPWEP